MSSITSSYRKRRTRNLWYESKRFLTLCSRDVGSSPTSSGGFKGSGSVNSPSSSDSIGLFSSPQGLHDPWRKFQSQNDLFQFEESMLMMYQHQSVGENWCAWKKTKRAWRLCEMWCYISWQNESIQENNRRRGTKPWQPQKRADGLRSYLEPSQSVRALTVCARKKR